LYIIHTSIKFADKHRKITVYATTINGKII